MPLPERLRVDVACRVCGIVRRISKYEITDICRECRIKQPRPYQICDLSGQLFGKLRVISLSGRARREATWLCECECGNTKVLSAKHLKAGETVSCGCHRFRQGRLSRLPEYHSWKAMMARCYSPSHKDFHRYGGRGIVVTPRWHQFPSFLEDMGRRSKPGLTIDRIDNDKGYEPGNCRWATQTEQQRNRRGQRRLEMNGESKLLSEWCAEYGITRHCLSGRLSRGLTMEQAISMPRRRSPKR